MLVGKCTHIFCFLPLICSVFFVFRTKISKDSSHLSKYPWSHGEQWIQTVTETVNSLIPQSPFLFFQKDSKRIQTYCWRNQLDRTPSSVKPTPPGAIEVWETQMNGVFKWQVKFLELPRRTYCGLKTRERNLPKPELLRLF